MLIYWWTSKLNKDTLFCMRFRIGPRLILPKNKTVLSTVNCPWLQVWRESENRNVQWRRMSCTWGLWKITELTHKQKRTQTDSFTIFLISKWERSLNQELPSLRYSMRWWVKRVIKITRRMVSIPFRSHSSSRLPREHISIKTWKMTRTSTKTRLRLLVLTNHMSLFASKFNAISNCEHLRRSHREIVSQEV